MYDHYPLFNFSKIFYSWPSEPKPPLDHFPILSPKPKSNPSGFSIVENGERHEVVGYEIQMALAGFSESDVQVWHEGSILHIEGDNKDNSHVASKFTCSFHHKISCAKELNLPDSNVTLRNGILSVRMPIHHKTDNEKNYLLGGK